MTASGISDAEGGFERVLCNRGLLENRFSQAHRQDFLFVSHR